nr:DUF2254 domain-containing protein [uncultured Halomonas sp.]
MSSKSTNPLQILKSFRYSIAFLPSLLGLIYFVLALGIVVPYVNPEALPDFLDWLKFKEQGTASALLSTLIAGMISLMVFSFSMVMTVLSQAGNNFSHKLVFGLVSERPYQRVLGHYLGTILFILILLTVPLKGEVPSLWRSLGIYLGVIMVMHCLGLFVFFIHNVSQSVQINAITAGLYDETRNALARLESREDSERWRYMSTPPVIDESSHEILSNYSGYIQQMDLEAVAKLAERINGVVNINFSFGDYTVKDFPLFKVESPEPPSDKWRASLLGELVYVQGESPGDIYRDGLTQLMEIAIKALSPGINDPGTARLCIHQLTGLLTRRLTLTPCNMLTDDKGHTRVTWHEERFDSLLYRVFSPIFTYGKEDLSINMALLQALKTLSLYAGTVELDALQAHAQRVINALEEIVQDSLDRQFINERLNNGEHRLNLPTLLAEPTQP